MCIRDRNFTFRSVQTPNSASEATATWRFTNFVLYCIVLYKNRQTSCPLQTFVCNISRHLEFIIGQGHRVNWVSGSLDSWVTGSLGHKMRPSSKSVWLVCLGRKQHGRCVVCTRAEITRQNALNTWPRGLRVWISATDCTAPKKFQFRERVVASIQQSRREMTFMHAEHRSVEMRLTFNLLNVY